MFYDDVRTKIKLIILSLMRDQASSSPSLLDVKVYVSISLLHSLALTFHSLVSRISYSIVTRVILGIIDDALTHK